MKKILCIIILVVTCQYTYGRDNKDNRLIFEEYSEINDRKSSDDKLNSHLVTIELLNLFKYDDFSIQFASYNFNIEKEQLIDRGINGFGFFGKNVSGDDAVYLSILDNKVNGFINVKNEKYIVSTSDNGLYLISKSENNEVAMKRSEGIKINSSEKDKSESLKSSSTEKHKKIRMLVLYTDRAGNSPQAIYESILESIDHTNKTFNNSKINAQVELAYIGRTNYTEVDIYTDLERFMNKNDGIMDEVHTLRDLLQADVCVLFGATGWIGRAHV